MNGQSPIEVQYISTDDDSGYNQQYEEEFNILYKYEKKKKMELIVLFKFINDLKKKFADEEKCLLITYMVHFIKNRKIQIMFSHIKTAGGFVKTITLQDAIWNSAAITDKFSLSKLQDTFPIEIFNFAVLAVILKEVSYDFAFYLFPICCWNEAFNNQIIGKETRLFLLQCSMNGFMKFYDLQQKHTDKTFIMLQIAIKMMNLILLSMEQCFKNIIMK